MKTPVIITGRIALLGILTFFGVIFAVNGAFVYFAIDSWPGLSNENAYEHGRDYNQTLASAEAQNDLGWSTSATLSEERDHRLLRIEFVDADGKPLDGLKVTATLRRPVGADESVNVMLFQSAAGDYRSPVALPLAGRWHVYIEAEMDQVVRYRMRHEVMARE